MPIFHRNFVHPSDSARPGEANPEHLQRVGPSLPVQIAIPDRLASIYADNGQAIPTPREGFALFDTGASATCVDESVLRGLGLEPIQTAGISTPSGRSEANAYACALYFPGNPLPDMELSFVLGVQLQNQGYSALIGRDLLRDMILIYDGPGARITFAY